MFSPNRTGPRRSPADYRTARLRPSQSSSPAHVTGPRAVSRRHQAATPPEAARMPATVRLMSTLMRVGGSGEPSRKSRRRRLRRRMEGRQSQFNEGWRVAAELYTERGVTSAWSRPWRASSLSSRERGSPLLLAEGPEAR